MATSMIPYWMRNILSAFSSFLQIIAPFSYVQRSIPNINSCLVVKERVRKKSIFSISTLRKVVSSSWYLNIYFLKRLVRDSKVLDSSW